MSYPQQDIHEAILEGLEDHWVSICAFRKKVFAWTLVEELEKDPMYFHAVRNTLQTYDGMEKQTIRNFVDICKMIA